MSTRPGARRRPTLQLSVAVAQGFHVGATLQRSQSERAQVLIQKKKKNPKQHKQDSLITEGNREHLYYPSFPLCISVNSSAASWTCSSPSHAPPHPPQPPLLQQSHTHLYPSLQQYVVLQPLGRKEGGGGWAQTRGAVRWWESERPVALVRQQLSLVPAGSCLLRVRGNSSVGGGVGGGGEWRSPLTYYATMLYGAMLPLSSWQRGGGGVGEDQTL